jgi:uncharacterized protein YqjF (DUF2071 family)
VRDQIGHQLDGNLHSLGNDVGAWIDKHTEEKIRTAIGKAAKKGVWFKNLNAGLELGTIVAAALPHIENTPLAQSIRKIEDWVYGE